jgi:hypothetical protein
VPESDEVTVIPGLSARGGAPFSKASPFCHVKRQLAGIMAHTLAVGPGGICLDFSFAQVLYA